MQLSGITLVFIGGFFAAFVAADLQIYRLSPPELRDTMIVICLSKKYLFPTVLWAVASAIQHFIVKQITRSGRPYQSPDN